MSIQMFCFAIFVGVQTTIDSDGNFLMKAHRADLYLEVWPKQSKQNEKKQQTNNTTNFCLSKEDF